MRYRLFRRKSNSNYYFQFLTDDEQPILNSQGYADKDGRNNGLESVINNSGNADRYESVNNDDGTFAFILKAGNSQEIGRSPNYETAANRDKSVSVFQTEVPGVRTVQEGETRTTATRTQTVVTTSTTEIEKPYEADGNVDNYKPLGFYESNGTGVVDGFDSFSAEGLHYFSYNLGGNVYLISEGYKSTGARENGINSVTKNMSIEARYKEEVHPNGKYFFNLRAGNNQEIATSRWFDNEGDMKSVTARMIAGLGLAGKSVGEGTKMEAANRTATISIAGPPPPLEDKPKKKRKKRTTEKKPKVEKVYLANGTYLFNEITYQIFRSGNDKHYFTFKNKEGKTIFLNASVRGFETQEEAQLIVDEVMKYGPYEVNYDGKMARNGKYYFYLQGKDGQKLAKSFFYNSEEDMQEAVGTLLGSELQIAAAAAAASGKVVDDYLECKRYNGEAGFHRFQHEEEHYFSYNAGDGETVLRSEGYTTEAARENGISSVITNASLDARWKTGTALNDRYYFFSLRAGNHQEIARSCYYDDEGEMESALEWVRGHDSTIGKGAQQVDGVWWSASMLRSRQEEEAAEEARLKAEREAAAEAARLKTEEEAAAKAAEVARLKAEQEAEAARIKAAGIAAAAAAAALAAATPDKVVDDYLICKSYYGDPEFYRFKGEDGQHYFSYNDKDGETILRSEGYTTESARENGINSVIKNAPIEERWVTDTAMNGKYHFFALKAGNHQEIARSCYYEDKAAMLAAWGWVKGENSSIGIGSKMVGGALMSAALLSMKAEEDATAAAALAAQEAARKKAEEEAAALAAAEAKRKKEEEERKRKEKEAALAAAAAAAAALAAKNAAAAKEAEALRLRQEEERKRKEKEIALAAAAAAAAAALVAKKATAAKEAEAAALAARQKAERQRAAAATAAAATAAAAVNIKREEPSKPFLSGIWPWLLALLALLLLLWLLRGCFGCGADKIIPPVVVPVDTIETEVVPEDVIDAEPEVLEALGRNAAEMGFAAGTIEAQLADCLSDPNCDLSQTFTWDGTQYPFNSAKMSRGALPHVDNIAKLMKEYPNANLAVFGYIDGKESDIYNGPFGDGVITLSGIRARCLYKKLAKRGIDKSRMTFEGFGDDRPIASNDTREGRRKNRRTEVKITRR